MFGTLGTTDSLLDQSGLYKHAQKGRRLSAFMCSSPGVDEQHVKPGGLASRRGQIEFDTEFEAKEEASSRALLSSTGSLRLSCEVDQSYKNTIVLGRRRESKCSTFSCGPHHLRFTKSRLLEHPLFEDVSSEGLGDVGNLDDFSDFDNYHNERDEWEDEELTEAFSEKLNFSPIGKTLEYELLPKQGPSPVQTVIHPDQPNQLRADSFRLFEATVAYPALRGDEETVLEFNRNCYSPVSVPPTSNNRSDFFDSWDEYTGKLLSCAKDKLAQ